MQFRWNTWEPAVRYMVGFASNGSLLFGACYNSFFTACVGSSKQQESSRVINHAEYAGDTLSVSISEDNLLLATGCVDGNLFLWKTEKRLLCTAALQYFPILRLEAHNSSVWSVLLHSSSHYVISGSSDFSIRVWETKNGRLVQEMWHDNVVKSLALSPDGNRLASGSYDKTGRIWNWLTGIKLFTLGGHEGAVWAVAFSPDGQCIFTGSHDFRLRAWDTTSGILLYVLNVGAPVASVAVSPGSSMVIVASIYGLITFCHHPSGKAMASFTAQDSSILSVAYSPNGKWVYTCGETGVLTAWDASRLDCGLASWSSWGPCECESKTQTRSKVLSLPLPVGPKPCAPESKPCRCDQLDFIIITCCCGSLCFLLALAIFAHQRYKIFSWRRMRDGVVVGESAPTPPPATPAAATAGDSSVSTTTRQPTQSSA